MELHISAEILAIFARNMNSTITISIVIYLKKTKIKIRKGGKKN